jgi:hypothetical protein
MKFKGPVYVKTASRFGKTDEPKTTHHAPKQQQKPAAGKFKE